MGFVARVAMDSVNAAVQDAGSLTGFHRHESVAVEADERQRWQAISTALVLGGK